MSERTFAAAALAVLSAAFLAPAQETRGTVLGRVWRRDGKELFYVAEEKLMAVPVKAAGSSFEAGIPTKLFEAPLVRASHRNRYLVASNGQRFVVNMTVEQTMASPFTVVLNWLAAVKK